MTGGVSWPTALIYVAGIAALTVLQILGKLPPEAVISAVVGLVLPSPIRRDP